jgi:hypothetical protein
MQKVTINAAFSEKTSENYNSQQYSIGLEIEVAVNGETAEIENASAKLFQLCRKIVAAQKGVNVNSLLSSPETPAAAPQTAPAPSPSNNGSDRPITDKQIKYLFRLGHTAGLSNEQIRQLPRQYFKANKLEDLTANEASSLIETLSAKKQAA